MKTIDLLTFQFNRYGGSFVVEVSSCPAVGAKFPWGDLIDTDLVTAHDMGDRLRLGSRPPKVEDHWFEYSDDGKKHSQPKYESAAKHVLAFLSQAEDYWKKAK